MDGIHCWLIHRSLNVGTHIQLTHVLRDVVEPSLVSVVVVEVAVGLCVGGIRIRLNLLFVIKQISMEIYVRSAIRVVVLPQGAELLILGGETQ